MWIYFHPYRWNVENCARTWLRSKAKKKLTGSVERFWKKVYLRFVNLFMAFLNNSDTQLCLFFYKDTVNVLKLERESLRLDFQISKGGLAFK